MKLFSRTFPSVKLGYFWVVAWPGPLMLHPWLRKRLQNMDLQAVAGDRLEIPRAMGENAGKSSNFTAWIFQHATVDFRRLSMTLMCDMQKKHLHKLFNSYNML